MEKKLPKLFKKEVTTNTNTKIYNLNKKLSTINNSSLTVEEKVKKLFKSNRYVFNIGVIIKTKKKEYDTKIIGKIKNTLITIDDDEIPIIEIEDIIIKDH